MPDLCWAGHNYANDQLTKGTARSSMTAQNTALALRMSEASPVKIPPEHENVISNQFQVVYSVAECCTALWLVSIKVTYVTVLAKLLKVRAVVQLTDLGSMASCMLSIHAFTSMTATSTSKPQQRTLGVLMLSALCQSTCHAYWQCVHTPLGPTTLGFTN